MTEHGIDTWKLSRYLDSDRDLEHARSLCTQRTARGLLAPETVNGHRLGLVPDFRMLWVEGHPAVEGLGPPAGLADAQEQLLAALDESNVPIGRDGGISRLDLTTTLRFPEPQAGLAFLSGLALADVPRVKPVVWGRPPETVYFVAEQSGRALSRGYDKGRESRSERPGVLIRLEDQRRFPKRARMSAEVMSEHPQITRSFFERRFAPVAASVDGLKAGTLPVVAERVQGLVSDGKLTYRQAERLLGYLALQGPGAPLPSQSTAKRRRRELRQAGLVLVDPMNDPIEVDLGEALDAALAAWSDDGED